jgi:hypothetical protein
MKEIKLVIGDAEKSERGKLRGKPLYDNGTWSPELASSSAIVRFIRKLLGKENDDKIKLALWLEGGTGSGYPDYARGVRIVLHFIGDPPVEACSLWSPFDLSYFTNRREDGMVINIQMHRDFVMYPTTSNYIGVFELRWPYSNKQRESDFCVVYHIFSLDTPINSKSVVGSVEW